MRHERKPPDRGAGATASRRSLVVVSGTLLVLLSAAVFRGQLLEPLIVRTLQRALGLHATFEHVGGSVAAGLDLSGVKARGEAGTGPVVSFEAGSVNARYSLAALFRGKGAFLDSLEVTVAGGRLDLDLTLPRSAASRAAGTPSADPSDPASKAREQPAGPPGFPALPRLAVRDSRLRLRGAGYEIEVDGLQGTVARADRAREQAVEIRADRFSFRHPALREGTLALAIRGRYAPRRLTIAAAHVDGEPLVQGASLDLGERPGDLGVQLALRLRQGSVEIGVLRRETGTEVRWDARGVDLRPDLLLVNPALGALRGRLSTSGSARLGGNGLPTLAGALSLDWEGGQIAGRAVDALAIEASAEPGLVRVESAKGRIGPNEILLQRVDLPAPPLFAGRWRSLLAAASGSFSASLGDVPAFLALWGVKTGGGSTPLPTHLLRLEGTLEKGTVRLARGDLAAGPGKATLDAVTVSLPREDQGWGETGFSGGATVDIPGLQEVSALFPMPKLGGSLRGAISGRGTFARPEGRASLAGRGITIAGRTIGDVDLEARGSEGRIEVDTLQVRQGGNRLTARGVRFSSAALAASDSGGFHDSLAGAFEARSTDLPALLGLAGVPREKVAPLPAEHLLAVAGTVDGRVITLTKGSFTAAGGTVTLHTARFSLPSSWAEWRKDTGFEGDVAVDVPDLGPLAAIFRLPPLQGGLKGRAQVAGSAGDPTGTVEASGRGIVVGGHRVGDFAVKLSVRRRLVRVETLEVIRGADRLLGRGSYDLATGTVSDAEADLTVADVAPWVAELTSDRIPVSGRLHALLSAAGPLPGTPVTVEAELSDGSVQDVRAIRGSVEAQINLEGTLRQLHVAAATLGARLEAQADGRTGLVTLDGGYEAGRLRIRALEARGSGGLTLQAEGTLPVDPAASGFLGPGNLSVRARVSMPNLEDVSLLLPPAYRVAGSLGADVVASGTWKEPQIRLEISGERLELAAGTRFAPPGPYTLAGTVTWGPTEARAGQVRLDSAALACSLSGAWTSPPPLTALLSRNAGWAKGSLDLRAAFSFPDLGWLRGAVEGVRGLRGSVAGEIVVAGPVADPLYTGSARLTEGAFRYRDLPPVDAVTARASVAGRKLILEEVAGNVGGSPFALAGSVDLARIEDPALDLRLRGKNALLYRAEGLRVRADSDLTLRGPVSALSLAGEVALTDSVYQRTFSVVDLISGGGDKQKKPATSTTAGFAGISFPEPPLRDMRLDVRLSGREPFRILTTVVRGTALPDLRLTGTGLLPTLRGSISFGATQLALPSGILEFERGSVNFRERAAGSAELDFSGLMQAQGLDITAQVGGTLDQPEIILSSLPPLPKEELLLFVLTGAPPGSSSAEGGYVTAMATPMAVYLGKGVLERLLGGGGAGLQSRLEVNVGRETTRSGGVTMDAKLLLKKNLFRKDSALFVTTEQDEYDQDNVGVRLLFRFK